MGFHGTLGTRIWDLVEEQRIEVFLSPFILEEFARNLVKKAGFTIEEAAELSEDVRDLTHVIDPQIRIATIQKKDSDNRILECAVEANAQVLVTGDLKHIRCLGTFQGIEILTPTEFLDKYFQGI